MNGGAVDADACPFGILATDVPAVKEDPQEVSRITLIIHLSAHCVASVDAVRTIRAAAAKPWRRQTLE